MTAVLAMLALVLVAVMVGWLIRDVIRSLRMPHWPMPRKNEER